MALVRSIEKLTISLADSVVSVDTPLTKGQVTANCVPFHTMRVVTPPAGGEGWSYLAVKLSFVGNSLRAETVYGAVRSLIIEVTVVEFNPAEVRVQQSIFSMASGAISDTVTIPTPVVLANTFALSTWTTTSGTTRSDAIATRTSFLSNSQLFVNREIDGGRIVSGHSYIVEALLSGFSVQTIDSLVTGLNVTGVIPGAVTMDKTFLVGSFDASVGTQAYSGAVPYIYLSDATSVALTRLDSSGQLNATVFVISFSPGGAEIAQRGLHTDATIGGVASTDVSLTASVRLADAMPWITSSSSFRRGSADDNSTQVGIHDSLIAAEILPDAVTLRLQRSIADATPLTTENVYAWEVIEWDTAPPPRRVLVRS